jgi:hypothetical protein
MPVFRDLFDRPDGPGLGEAWSDRNGQPVDAAAWRIENGEAITTGGTAFANSPPRENYLLDAYLRPIRSSGHQVIRSSAGAGLIAAAIDEKEQVVVAIGPERIVLHSRTGSGRSAPLPPGFRPEVYHHLRVERNAGRIRVQLDGLALLEGDYAPGPARVGLRSELPGAFDGIALTAHFADDFAGGEARGWWAAQHSHWDVQDGALVQPESGAARHEIAKGEPLENWEVHVDLHFLSTPGSSGPPGTAGVRVRPANGAAPVEAALEISPRVDAPHSSEAPHPSTSPGLCRLSDAYRPLPAAFDPSIEHHLRLEKWENRLSLWLDGQPVAEIEVPADASRFALFTDGAAAAFRDVSFTGLA